MCKQKIVKIIHSIESAESYKEFIPAPTTGQSLHVQFEDSFDFNQTFDSDHDTSTDDLPRPRREMVRAMRPHDSIRMLQPIVRITEQLNIDALSR